MVRRGIDREIGRRLEEVPGFVALRRIGAEDAGEILKIESEAERRAVLGAIPAENRGVREALKREVVYAIAYRPEFFASFGEWVRGSSVVMMSGGEIVGEEVTDRKRLDELKRRSDAILIGAGFVLYKERVRRARGEAEIILPGRPFPPLHDLVGVRNVVSGSPSSPVDRYLKARMGVDTEDPDIGTVIVGVDPVGD